MGVVTRIVGRTSGIPELGATKSTPRISRESLGSQGLLIPERPLQEGHKQRRTKVRSARGEEGQEDRRREPEVNDLRPGLRKRKRRRTGPDDATKSEGQSKGEGHAQSKGEAEGNGQASSKSPPRSACGSATEGWDFEAEEEACSKRRRRHRGRLGPRRGPPPASGEGQSTSSWSITGVGGGHLFWGKVESGGSSDKGGSGGARHLPDDGLERDRQRECPEGLHSRSAAEFQSSSLPPRLRSDGEWREDGPRHERTADESGRRGSLGDQPGRGRQIGIPCPGDGTSEAKSRRSRRSSGASPRTTTTSELRRGREVQRQRIQKGEKEKEKEEGEGRKGEDHQWAPCSSSRDQGGTGTLCWDRPGPARPSSTKSPSQSKEVRQQEEAKKLKQQREQWGKPFKLRWGGAYGGGRGVHRAIESQGSVGAVSGRSCGRVVAGYEKSLADGLRRRGDGRYQTHSPALLPQRPEQASHRGSSPRAPDAVLNSGCISAWTSRGGNGHSLSTPKEPRGSVARVLMDRCPATGDSTPGNTINSWQERVATGPQGELRGEQGKMAQQREQRWQEGRRQEQEQGRQERQGWWLQGRQEGRSPRKEQRQEGLGGGEEPPGFAVAAKACASPKSHPGGVPLKGAMSLSRIDSKSKYIQRAPWSKPPVISAGVFPPIPPSPLVAGVVQKTPDLAGFESSGQCAGPKDPDLSTGDGKADFFVEFEKKSLVELGHKIHQWLLEVLPLRSQTTGGTDGQGLFPLPTSREKLSGVFHDLGQHEISWLASICLCLNSMYGCDLFFEGTLHPAQLACLKLLARDVARLHKLQSRVERFDWDSFFSSRGIDYKGDEVKTAKSFCWGNIKPAFPPEIGRVPLQDVCTLGAQYYVNNFDLFIKRAEHRTYKKPPRVMVADQDWPAVCQGLVDCGVCTFLPSDQVFDTGHGPLLNGMFGVTKDEVEGGFEVYRLIMNMIPLNLIAEPIKGDVDTLPMWSMMTPYVLQPHDNLVISSEDVRCFFYTISVPSCWYKFLAFNKVVPDHVLPSHLRGQKVFLASKVLPMGFLNSVSLAQHVHRNLALWSGESPGEPEETNKPEGEIRKDRATTISEPQWRIYLDNYDLLERVRAVESHQLEGSVPAAVLALRQEYEKWEVPRNLKKSVSRSTLAEVQGAQVDGVEGIAYPRDVKLLKYFTATMSLIQAKSVTLKQLQVACGGLVYISMFRRPLLGSLNLVWKFMQDFSSPHQRKLLPHLCRLELIRFLGLIPLARLDFRMDYHEQVTCSDASTTGGGICASGSLTPYGSLVSEGLMRGQHPELRSEHRVLSVGLFDGIGALRVALDLLGVEILGHVSVEKEGSARRVVESHFPEAKCYEDVVEITEEIVQSWANEFSQASLVVLGAGPPCQGVSGLNASRRGALRDERSSLFWHVRRIWDLLRVCFPWCAVRCLMESVASMDSKDRGHMSESFGSAPWSCDAGTMTWCNRPRLYWISWDLSEQDGVLLHSESEPAQAVLEAFVDLEECCKDTWIKVEPSRPFPTFTTSRPRDSPGFKPAGLAHCSSDDLTRWKNDSHRYPPYQYMSRNLLVDKHGNVRLPDIQEKEFIMGFPVNYTTNCVVKSKKKSIQHEDLRHTLIGNTWCVPVVAWLLSQLLSVLGLCPNYTPQNIMDMLNPKHQIFLQSRLWRQPLRPLRGQQNGGENHLVQKLGCLVSVKGEDILLTTPSSQMTKFHRLRTSVPSKLWRWKVVSGWTWRGQPEHINSLELRAVLTTLKWRIAHKLQVGCRFLHLVDSLVVLHALSRGRSSSRKLRSSLSRVNALLLCSSTHALWGYVHTDLNPADKPSRWGKRVRTRFRNA